MDRTLPRVAVREFREPWRLTREVSSATRSSRSRPARSTRPSRPTGRWSSSTPRTPPSATRSGTCYARQGKKKDAIAEYLEASDLYEKDGFGPRAIAISQKIDNLDPEQWGVRLKSSAISTRGRS